MVALTSAQKKEAIKLYNAYEALDFKLIKSLNASGVSLRRGDINYCYYKCAYGGRLDILKHLIEQTGGRRNYLDYALNCAITGGHIKVVKYLIQLGAGFSMESFSDACYEERWDIIKYLLAYCQEELFYQKILEYALYASITLENADITELIFELIRKIPKEHLDRYFDAIVYDCIERSLTASNYQSLKFFLDVHKKIRYFSYFQFKVGLLKEAARKNNLKNLKLLMRRIKFNGDEIIESYTYLLQNYPKDTYYLSVKQYLIESLPVKDLKIKHLNLLLRYKQHKLVLELIFTGAKVSKRILKRFYYIV